mgnify:CR=1 FL=1
MTGVYRLLTVQQVVFFFDAMLPKGSESRYLEAESDTTSPAHARIFLTVSGKADEIAAIEKGEMSATDNVLKNAPHTIEMIAQTEWTHPYTREQAVYPTEWQRVRKFWSTVGRIDNAYGDRNLICSCPSVEEYK